MKKIKMLKIMASSEMTANIGDIITVSDGLAEQLINAGACIVIQDISMHKPIETATKKIKKV